MKTLKNTITLLLILTISNLANAQFWENNSIYIGMGGQYGSYKSPVADINYIYKEKYSLQLRFANQDRLTKVPSDYRGYLLHDVDKTYQVLLGRVYKLNKSGSIKANLKSGISYNIFHVAHNFVWHEPTSSGGWLFGSSPTITNYYYKRTLQKELGLIINPSIDLRFGRIVGVSVAPLINISSYQTTYGGELSLIIGILSQV